MTADEAHKISEAATELDIALRKIRRKAMKHKTNTKVYGPGSLERQLNDLGYRTISFGYEIAVYW
jgi:hypothetical protein